MLFSYKCALNFASLLLADMFINKLKTKFNSFFYRMVLNIKKFHNSFQRTFPARAKQMPAKVLFVGEKTRRPFGHCASKLQSLATVNELKIVISFFSIVSLF